MFTYTKTSPDKTTFIFSVKIPQTDIAPRYEAAMKSLSADTKVEGFRKGKAPADLVNKKLRQEKIYDELIRKLLPDIYEHIIKTEKVEPAISPKVELKKALEKEDWLIEFTVALNPHVTIPEYKKIVTEVKSGYKKEAIWVPGKDEKAEDSEEQLKKREKLVNDILEAILKKTTLELSSLIIEQELNARLSRLVDDVRKIGLSMDDYLKSKNLTHDSIKQQFENEIRQTYILEFLLSEIADKEKIIIEKEEIEKLISGIKDPATREDAQKNTYFYATLLRKQKVIDYLVDL